MPKEKTGRPQYGILSNIWFMLKLAVVSKEKKVLILGLITALTAVALNLVNLYLPPVVLARVEEKSSPFRLITAILLFTAAIMLLSAILAYVNANILFGKVSLRSELVNRINLKAATTSYPNVDNESFRQMLSKAGETVNTNSAPGEAIWDTLISLISSLLGFIIYVFLLTSVQPMLILVIAICAAISYFIGNRLNSYGYRHREEEALPLSQMDYLTGCARDLSAAKDIRIFGLKPWLNELYDKSMQAYMAFQNKVQSIYFWTGIADLTLSFLRNGIAYAYLISQVLSGQLTAARFLLFFTAVSGFGEWVTKLLNGLQTLYRQSLELSTLREFLAFPEPFRFEGGTALPKKETACEIRLVHVSFRYPGAEQNTLTDINLTLHPGEKLAIVGLNGAGKTTLVKLICGFLDPTEGQVLLNGQDIRTFNRREYYELFSAVFQTFSLLASTVAVNVAQDETNIDQERLIAAIEKAGLREKLEALTKGCESRLNREIYEDAVTLSGGETQHLMLARALYRDAPFIILDEPTAALDPIAEADLYQKYHEMTKHKSSVYISHRLSSTRFCDRILLLMQGKIEEEGTHEELLSLGGEYARLYGVQSKYYQEEEEENHENK